MPTAESVYDDEQRNVNTYKPYWVLSFGYVGNLTFQKIVECLLVIVLLLGSISTLEYKSAI